MCAPKGDKEKGSSGLGLELGLVWVRVRVKVGVGVGVGIGLVLGLVGVRVKNVIGFNRIPIVRNKNDLFTPPNLVHGCVNSIQYFIK